ncbi:MAG: hypothetical protein ACO35E_03675 [Ilumatobacteraceae bacterium]
MAGNPFTNPDWAAETTDQIERLVGTVRARVTTNVVHLVRGIVFGLIGLLVGIVLAVLVLIMVTRGFQALISLATGDVGVGRGRSVYLSYLIVGGLLLVGGGACMSRRFPKD